MPARTSRSSSSSSSGGNGSSTRSYSEDQVHAFAGENNDNKRESSAKPAKSGLASFQASGRFLASYDHHRDARDAPLTSRRHRGGDTYGINRSGVDDARKLEEGVRGLRYGTRRLPCF